MSFLLDEVLKFQLTMLVNMACFDAPLRSLMDSTMSPKMKTTKGERIGVRSLARNTLRVEGHVGARDGD
jgi:hypothetical protein